MTKRQYEIKRKRRIRERKQKLFIQQMMGLGLLIMSFIFLVTAIKSQYPGDGDCTCLLFTVPLGLFMLFSKDVHIM